MVGRSGVAASHLLNSLKPAPITASLFGRGQAIAQLLTARQRDFEQEPARIAVAKRRIAENRVISGLEGALGPARAGQNPRARDFKDPSTWRITCRIGILVDILGVRLDDEGDVRVDPIDGLDGAFYGFGMIEIVGRIRM